MKRLNVPVPGSSPHGRGTVQYFEIWTYDLRFIPAWAGNRVSDFSHIEDVKVHPRMGGEQVENELSPSNHAGSSPHGRGTDAGMTGLDAPIRFIPAWAGNRLSNFCRLYCGAVHPRMGGEQCGENVPDGLAHGSSPHGRGTGIFPHGRLLEFRFIPAWAGNRHSYSLAAYQGPVHPRMGGEQRKTSGKTPR